MWFRVLGPVGADTERGPVELGPARQRVVLAVLLAELGTVVSVDQLVDRVWGATPPQRARQTLHTYLSRLRSALLDAGGPVPTRRSAGYLLEVAESAVDLHRFRSLVAQARQADDDERAAAVWQDAMALWRGRPFADLDSDWLHHVAAGLEAERLAARLDHTDVLLRRGEHARLLPELTAAAGAHPLDERLAGQLMLALYRCGRQADALAQYRLLHDRLVDELGSDPGPALRQLHQRILRHDPRLATSCAGETPGSGDPPVEVTVPAPRPAQLPADVAGFTGRTGDLRRLDELLPGTAGDRTTRAVVITAIGGPAGVGKTALAVHWAHRVAHRFPDGQLYVNLRGYDPDQPVSAADALTRLLAALGVTGQNIPLDLDERAARYRSELAGRRMLVVLDNAADVAQVRPLLPGTGSCLVVVTSRDSLAGLVAVHGAHRIGLDLLPAGEAVDLLRRLVGARVAAEPQAAAALAEQCVRLPLALRVAAELAAARPGDSLADLVAELADRQTRLELLDTGGDVYAAVQEVFSWSIRHLPPPAARTFRLLALHPGPDLDPYAVAALAGTDTAQARQTLALLTRTHLVHRTGRDRYGMHDLLRAYAIHLAAAEETDQQRHAAHQRLLDYYQTAAAAAMDTLHPAEADSRPEAGGSATHIPDLTEPPAAHAWLETERLCLVATVAQAAATGSCAGAVGLARILFRYLDSGYPNEALTISGHALRAAERAGDCTGQAHALRQLGTAYFRLSQYGVATERLQQALVHYQQADDLAGEAQTMTKLGVVASRQGNHRYAIDCHLRAIDLAQRAGDQFGAAMGMMNRANVEYQLGQYPSAANLQRQAIAIFHELGSTFGEAAARNNLANSELQQGRYESAGKHLRQSLAIIQQLSSPITEAHILDTLGTLHLRLGEPERANGYFRQALTVFRRAGARAGQAEALNGLGEAVRLCGDLAACLAHHTEALAIAAETNTRREVARAHTGLGHAHRALDDPDQARTHYEQAHTIYTALDLPDAGEVLEHLRSVTAQNTRRVAGLAGPQPERDHQPR